ncbi:MAG: hypothetical protein KDK97_05145 [Verrucomicrobiales bacterium]|nr:hypothetical protein [Verrucomicrobiales bacterium]MCP5558583.1 hypothetical protein [Verrucomicrobiaceae bacterium]
MHRPTLLRASLSILSIAVATQCTNLDHPPEKAELGSFASVRPVLESKCVHCHGENRLANMPPFGSTGELAKLKAEAMWLVAGKPERSRLYQVVTLKDEQPGAMPPTGHAIDAEQVTILREWIASGAPLPEGRSIALKPRGELVRSN